MGRGYTHIHTSLHLSLSLSLTKLVKEYDNLIFFERFHFYQVVQIVLAQLHHQHDVVLHLLTDQQQINKRTVHVVIKIHMLNTKFPLLVRDRAGRHIRSLAEA